ncbi:ABC transporter permease [Rubripirellula amarantea]|uniref:Macrolide export ATP-binding/permease protein MacB n=1 Tax=Rubripirellula amarantea TaxID=2527999 RepID=A0A5C5WLS0_9BACT|nr:FtsX-like permease family protein [Rubripirellula amarantea]MDA8744626.1 ABC transporter permease [Rubripirellula amarantea]TWT51115.1 Macrolide export ATP-binding/permease protein MacB [Rubripirellula amarantea]
MIPLKYNLRSLRVRWATTLLTCVAIGVVVFASVLTFGMIDGIENALTSSGDSEDLIIMRQGSNDEMSSTVDPNVARELVNLPGIAASQDGQPLASREFVTILIKPRRGGDGTANVIVRGLDTIGRSLRPKFKIVEGRDIQPGVNEVITSRNIADRFETLALGESFEINKVAFKVVGLFEADGSSAESEVWTDLRDLTSAQRYDGAISVVNMRVPDAETRREIVERVRNDEQFKLKVVSEQDYFEDQKSSSVAIKVVAYLIAGFLTVGAMFAAANTMYSAVASRGREIGTLRAVGFPRRAVLTSFLMESLVLCLIGGALGCLATIPFNGITGGTQNLATFSEITFSFRFGPRVLAQGMGLAVAMGLIGGILPAVRAIRLEITDALRQR